MATQEQRRRRARRRRAHATGADKARIARVRSFIDNYSGPTSGEHTLAYTKPLADEVARRQEKVSVALDPIFGFVKVRT